MKLQKNKLSHALPITLLVGVLSLPAHADITINIYESGGNVVADYSGSVDLGATTGYLFGGQGQGNWFGDIDGVGYFASGNLAAPDGMDFYSVGAPVLPGLGNAFLNGFWSSLTGDPFSVFGDPAIGLPGDYASGAPLSGSVSAPGGFSDYGIIPGTVTGGFSNGSVSETVTLIVGDPPISAIPEVTGSSVILGLLGLSLLGRRRQR